MKIRVLILEGRGNQGGTSLTVRGHSDMNSINPHEVRIQLIQLLNKVSSHSMRAPGVHLLSLASLFRTHPVPKPQEVLLVIRVKGEKVSLSTLPLGFCSWDLYPYPKRL